MPLTYSIFNGNGIVGVTLTDQETNGSRNNDENCGAQHLATSRLSAVLVEFAEQLTQWEGKSR